MAVRYCAEAKRVTDTFLATALQCSDSDWTMVKKSNGVRIYNRNSTEPHAGHIYKAEVTLDISPARLFTMVTPTKPYRAQWDQLLAKLQVVATIDRNVYLVYHQVHPSLKGLVAARDSIDVVTVGQTDEFYFVAAGSTEHADYPPCTHFIRAFQYPSGYVIFKIPNEPERSRFVMVFHADLNMNNVANFMVDMIKPTLMIQKIDTLRKGIATIAIKDEDVEDAPRCTPAPSIVQC